MSLTDPVADLLTRIRNANSNQYRTVKMPFSHLKQHILRVIKEQGYILDYAPEMDGKHAILKVELKYGPDGEKVIRKIDRISKPGRRIYRGAKDLPNVLNGLGIAILSTSRGVMSNNEARKLGLGGEVICEIY